MNNSPVLSETGCCCPGWPLCRFPCWFQRSTWKAEQPEIRDGIEIKSAAWWSGHELKVSDVHDECERRGTEEHQRFTGIQITCTVQVTCSNPCTEYGPSIIRWGVGGGSSGHQDGGRALQGGHFKTVVSHFYKSAVFYFHCAYVVSLVMLQHRLAPLRLRPGRFMATPHPSSDIMSDELWIKAVTVARQLKSDASQCFRCCQSELTWLNFLYDLLTKHRTQPDPHSVSPAQTSCVTSPTMQHCAYCILGFYGKLNNAQDAWLFLLLGNSFFRFLFSDSAAAPPFVWGAPSWAADTCYCTCSLHVCVQHVRHHTQM